VVSQSSSTMRCTRVIIKRIARTACPCSSSRWPAHSEAKLLNIQGFHLLEQEISLFFVVHEKSLPFPISLATTFGISVDVFSFSYLDVSVH